MFGTYDEAKKVNVRVEYECTPIKHIAVQCPNCKKWFYGWDILEGDIRYEHDIVYAHGECPICGVRFMVGADTEIREVGHPQVYDGCVNKKTVWE